MLTSGLGVTTSGFAKNLNLESASKIASGRTISRVSAIQYVGIIHEKRNFGSHDIFNQWPSSTVFM